jgi:arylsulfatase B|eukprot:COSAG06_NODE_9667_length_1847_cov_3.663043_2_plen_86_part_00
MLEDRYKYCSPTRSQINTGRYPYHNGFWHNNCPPAQLEGIPLKFVTIAEELASAGYSTHAIGKWHQGQASDAFTPTRRGFSTFLG